MQNHRLNSFQTNSPTSKYTKQLMDMKSTGTNSQPRLPPLGSKMNSYNRNRSINNPSFNTKDFSLYNTKTSNNVLARGGRFQFQSNNDMSESEQLHSKNMQMKSRLHLDNSDSLQNEMLKRDTRNMPQSFEIVLK